MASSRSDPDLETLIDELNRLEQTVDTPQERQHVRTTLSIAERIPGSQHISKYTTRDVAEAFVGGVLFALPLLVEGGVFEIAEHLVATRIGGVPIFLLGNVLFVIMVTVGLIYWSDIRPVRAKRPLFGIFPRRLLGVLITTLGVATGLMILWGRVFEGDPTTLEAVARISVVWAAAAFGGSLGDILPGESRGHDIVIENFDDIILPG